MENQVCMRVCGCMCVCQCECVHVRPCLVISFIVSVLHVYHMTLGRNLWKQNLKTQFRHLLSYLMISISHTHIHTHSPSLCHTFDYMFTCTWQYNATALHIAACANQGEACAELISLGSNIEAKNVVRVFCFPFREKIFRNIFMNSSSSDVIIIILVVVVITIVAFAVRASLKYILGDDYQFLTWILSFYFFFIWFYSCLFFLNAQHIKRDKQSFWSRFLLFFCSYDFKMKKNPLFPSTSSFFGIHDHISNSTYASSRIFSSAFCCHQHISWYIDASAHFSIHRRIITFRFLPMHQHGATSLHLAAEANATAAIRVLLLNKANIKAVNNVCVGIVLSGHLLQWHESKNESQLICVSICSTPCCGHSRMSHVVFIIMSAFSSSCALVLDIPLHSMTSYDTWQYWCEAVVHAADKGSLEALVMLLDAGADVDAMDPVVCFRWSSSSSSGRSCSRCCCCCCSCCCEVDLFISLMWMMSTTMYWCHCMPPHLSYDTTLHDMTSLDIILHHMIQSEYSALQFAALKGHLSVAIELIKRGADITRQTPVCVMSCHVMLFVWFCMSEYVSSHHGSTRMSSQCHSG